MVLKTVQCKRLRLLEGGYDYCVAAQVSIVIVVAERNSSPQECVDTLDPDSSKESSLVR